jgi:hypothetical protein
MWKIRYNIAENKKIDYMKFGLFSSIVAVISLLFIMLGVGNLWSSDKRVRVQKETANRNEERLKKLTKNVKMYQNKVIVEDSKWKKEKNFANSLIAEKVFHITKELDTLEEHLPEGVFFTHMGWDVENQSKIQVSIAAQSLPRLIETYEIFSKKYNVVRKDENEDEGLFKASLILNPGRSK